MRHTLGLPTMLALMSAAPLAAQVTLAERVANAPDGEVRMEFESRAGACGNGRDMVAFGRAMFARNFESNGTWKSDSCRPGPVRVTLRVAGRHVTDYETRVGGAWPAAGGRVTDLGSVAPREASAYFFSLVPRLESSSGKDRLLLPAVLANDPNVVPPLLALARDRARTARTRRSAIVWLGHTGDARIVPALAVLARESADDPNDMRGRRSIAEAALAALGTLKDGVGMDALIDFARTGAPATRHSAVFWLGQSGDPRAIRTLHTVIEDANEESKVREHAIFSLSHGDEVADAEFAYLRSMYQRLEGDKLKEAVLFGMSEDRAAGGRWLLERARDTRESMRLRKSALFWAGQREATPTADIAGVYRAVNDATLREHAIFVLSQRKDEEALNVLIGIARSDNDTRMRGKALFWLAQKDDPRVTKLIGDLVLR